DTHPSQIYTLSLHDALPISWISLPRTGVRTVLSKCMLIEVPSSMTSSIRILNPIVSWTRSTVLPSATTAIVQPSNDLHRSALRRSEEHTSELQSRSDLVCRL